MVQVQEAQQAIDARVKARSAEDTSGVAEAPSKGGGSGPAEEEGKAEAGDSAAEAPAAGEGAGEAAELAKQGAEVRAACESLAVLAYRWVIPR